MANKSLFETVRGLFTPPSNAVNDAGGKAYQLTPKDALAQYALTGCLSQTYYTDAAGQLAKVLELATANDAEFIAKTAIYARERGHMKDMPALLVAILAVRDKALFERVFPRVIDNGKMLRNFVQIIRSGAVGRKSLGSLPKRMVREWFAGRKAETIFRQSVGQTPSFADILKMVHPKPDNDEKQALYGWLIGRDADVGKLPAIIRDFESFKRGETSAVPDVPFQMLTAHAPGRTEWTAIARRAPWQATRMNLNTFERHGVFESEELVGLVADRLRNAESIKRARVFPYQLLTAYSAAAANPKIPAAITEALQDAMETAIANVPKIDGKVFVFPDVSGSMSSSATGYRKGSTSTVRCIDVAALVAATVLRKNPTAEVLPFEQTVVRLRLNPRDSVMTNATRLAAVGGGGTNCAAPLAELNDRGAKGDLIIYVSDNESWIDTNRGWNPGTQTLREWNLFKARNPRARLVLIDIQPGATTQATERDDILNVGGFSDTVFELIAEFAAGELSAARRTGVIDAIEL